MLKILLADDNILMLNQLNELLAQLGSCAMVIGQAMDGREAVALACKLLPDLVIMDVEMPLQSGIEATTELHEKLPAVKVLALSNYDNFQYLRGMLKAGALDYLLKHELSLQLLSHKLDEVSQLLSQESESALKELHYSLVAKQSLLASLADSVPVKPDYQRIVLQQPEFPSRVAGLCILRITNYAAPYRHPNQENKKNLLQSVLNLCSNIFASIHNGLITTMEQGEFLVLFNFDSVVSQRKANELMQEYMTLIKGNLKRILGVDILMDSCFFHGFPDALPQYYERLSRQMEQKSWDELLAENPAQMDILDERELINGLENLNERQCSHVLSRIFTPIADCKATAPADDSLQQLAINLLVLLERYLHSRTLEAELAMVRQQRQELALDQSAIGLRNTVMDIFSKLLASMTCNSLTEYSPHIQKAIRHLQNNYASNSLSMSEVAELLGLSSSYFSKVFKEEVGVTFVDYLTGLRINKAKLLLCETTMSIVEVGQRVGFQNYSYFIRVFREQAGQPPVSYQKQHKKKHL